jgi:hypothetical protein
MVMTNPVEESAVDGALDRGEKVEFLTSWRCAARMCKTYEQIFATSTIYKAALFLRYAFAQNSITPD